MKTLILLLLCNATLAGTVVLTWQPPVQNTDGSPAVVATYDVLRDGAKIANVAGTSYSDLVAPTGTHQYSLRSIDAVGAVSTASAPLDATTYARTSSTVIYDWRHWTDPKGTHAYIWAVGSAPLRSVCGNYLVKYDTRNFYSIDPNLVTLTKPRAGQLVGVCK